MRILYFYPENPLLLNQGNNARANALLHYFKSRSSKVDFVGIESDTFSSDDIQELESTNLIEKGYLLKQFKRKENKIKYFLGYSLPNFIKGNIKNFNRVRFGHQPAFDAILKSNEYDYIIISYVYWADLVIGNSNLKNAKLGIDTHDFLTAQFQDLKGFELGKYFQKEIETLNYFDEIFVISTEENYLFSQFIKKRITTLSHIIKNNFKEVSNNKKYDLIYVASNNSHNIAAADWFFREVHPLLNEKINILVIGRICNHIQDYANVTKIVFAEHLNDYYSNSKVAICPMLTGTGVKIKVIEALSFGLPVVCNLRGVDGLSNKSDNGCLVTNIPVEFANHIDLLLNDKAFYAQTSNYGKNYFLQNNDTEIGYTKIDSIFK